MWRSNVLSRLKGIETFGLIFLKGYTYFIRSSNVLSRLKGIETHISVVILSRLKGIVSGKTMFKCTFPFEGN